MIDTHCHLDNLAYKDDVDEVISNAILEGVDRFIIPGADINDLNRAKELSEEYESVFFSVGVHPYHIDQYEEDELIKYSKHKKCLSVGECGLDYFRLDENSQIAQQNIQEQKEVFIKQIELAIKLNKPLIVHVRDAKDNFDASNDAKEILKKYAIQSNNKLKGVLHCFNAYAGLLELSEYGFYFGIGGVLSFKNAKNLQEVLCKIPKDKLLLETDAPYLTPHPYRGERNEPKYVSLVLDKMSEILSQSQKELEELTNKNANALFGI